MKDDIKEILDKLRSDDYYEKEYQKSVYYERDLKKLEDYITNLEQIRIKAIGYMQDNNLSNFDKDLYYILTGGDE